MSGSHLLVCLVRHTHIYLCIYSGCCIGLKSNQIESHIIRGALRHINLHKHEPINYTTNRPIDSSAITKWHWTQCKRFVLASCKNNSFERTHRQIELACAKCKWTDIFVFIHLQLSTTTIIIIIEFCCQCNIILLVSWISSLPDFIRIKNKTLNVCLVKS